MPEIGVRFGTLVLSEDRAAEAWREVAFDPPFETGISAVIVLPMTQTYSGAETPGLRVRNVTRTSFEVRFDEILNLKEGGRYSSEGTHARETVGWVAYGIPQSVEFPADCRVGTLTLTKTRAANQWQDVSFASSFGESAPTIVVLPMTQTYKGPETPGLRICNVTKTGFDIRFDEVNILKAGGKYSSDGMHVPETVGWVAHTVKSWDKVKPHLLIEVGVLTLDKDRAANQWHLVNFSSPLAGDVPTPPVVIAMTQTYNCPETPGLRIRNVTKAGFEIRFDEVVILKDGGAYSSDGSHIPETVGWIAYASPTAE